MNDFTGKLWMYFPEFRSKHQTTHKNCAPITEVIIFFVDLSLQQTANFYAKNTYFIPRWYHFWPNLNRSNRSCTQTLEKQFAKQHAGKAQNSNQNWVRQIEKLWCLNFHQIFAIQTNHLVYIRAVYHWDFVRISWR